MGQFEQLPGFEGAPKRGTSPTPSVPASRKAAQAAVRSMWGGRGNRVSYDSMYAREDPDTSPHPRTGLPREGLIENPIPFNKFEPPATVSFESTTNNAWRRNQKHEFIPLTGDRPPQISSPQLGVVAERVHELMEDRTGASSARTGRGLGAELPRMFKRSKPTLSGPKHSYTVLDGNHRVSADILSNRMFTEAHVVSQADLDNMSADNASITQHKQMAAKKGMATTGRFSARQANRRLDNLWSGLYADGKNHI